MGAGIFHALTDHGASWKRRYGGGFHYFHRPGIGHLCLQGYPLGAASWSERFLGRACLKSPGIREKILSDFFLDGRHPSCAPCSPRPHRRRVLCPVGHGEGYLVIMLIFSGLYVFAYSINTIIVCGVFPAGGDARYDAVSVFFASWCFALPLAFLGTLFSWPVMTVYILMCSDEIVKLPWIYPRYKKYLWLKNLTREPS